MTPFPRSAVLAGGLVAVALTVAACSGTTSSAATPGGTAGHGGAVVVVASTNVYGDIVEQIGGDLVDVTSIVSDPAADPHSYEASGQTQLALSKADLVIENGGGYDDFVDTMLSALHTTPVVINAVDVSGKAAAKGAELNEHVWYDFPTVATLAARICDELSRLDETHAAEYRANASVFVDKITTLEASTTAIAGTSAGTGVAITEPVPGYLLDNAGLVDKTPPKFSQAIEEETDVPPIVLQETLGLFTSHQVKALVYNEQTTGAATEQVLRAAREAGIAVVPVTETLPTGEDYVSWMTGNVAALRTAVGP